MIAIFDTTKELRSFISKKLKDRRVEEIESNTRLLTILEKDLDKYFQVLINKENLNDSDYKRLLSILNTPAKQLKVLIYGIKNGIPMLLNTSIFNTSGNEDNKDIKSSIKDNKIEYKPIKNPFANKFEHICIGVSTGGPTTLEMVIPQFPKDIEASIVVIQHMLRGKYIYNLCDRLDKISQIHVKVAEDGDILKNGVAYFPPPGKHVCYKRHTNGEVSIHLIERYPKEDGTGLFEKDHKFIHIPSVDIGMESAADVYGDKMVAAILTGMGCDGALALKYARDLGAHTLSEAQETCVVFGMPKASYEKGGSMEVLKHYLIPNRILEIIGYKPKIKK